MKIKELEKDKITGLKVEYLLEVASPNESIDWNDIINIDEVISDSEIFNYYTGIEFNEDGSLYDVCTTISPGCNLSFILEIKVFLLVVVSFPVNS